MSKPEKSPSLREPTTEVEQFTPEFDTSKYSAPIHESLIHKVVFVATVCSSQLLGQGQIGMTMLPLAEIGESVGTTDPGQLSWMAASYALTLGVGVIIAGRLGDMYGPKLIWLIGYVIIIASNIGSGFCKTQIPFDICRALAGLGGSLAVPNAIAIFGRAYPPGPTRSLVFCLLGALGPGGFIFGGVFASLLAEKASANWIWFFCAMLAACFAILGLVVLPNDGPMPGGQFDIIGATLLVLGLGLFNFAWNQGPVVGWPTVYVYVLLIVSIFCLGGYGIWQKKVGRKALVPAEVLSKESTLVYVCLWLGWMSFGVFLFYTALFLRNIRGFLHPLSVVAMMCPLAPCGIIVALLVPTLIHRVPGHVIFAVSMACFFVGDLLVATAPENQTYWAQIFPALILVVGGPDLSFSTGQLLVSNSVDREFQGIAAGMVSLITNYSLSIGLGMAGTVERYVADDSTIRGYRAALGTGAGFAGLAFFVVVFFIRMDKHPRHHE